MNREDLVKLTSNINKNSCPKNINFHCHTKFSDGSLEPYELLDQAYKNNLKFYYFNNGYNSSNEYIAMWLWYYKNLAPKFLGGFE